MKVGRINMRKEESGVRVRKSGEQDSKLEIVTSLHTRAGTQPGGQART